MFIPNEPYSTEAVLSFVWDKYEVQSTQFGEYENPVDGEPGIYIDVYNEDDIHKVEKYLEKSYQREIWKSTR